VSASPGAELQPRPAVRLVARAGPPLGLIFGAIGLLATFAVGLLRLDRLPVALCYFKLLTGLPCPTCGSTRSVGQLFALDVPAAFAMNPLVTLAAFGIAAWAAADLALLPRQRALGFDVAPRLAVALRAVAVVVVVANWAYLLAAGR
jgi:hypothetical protein